ncbi:unnamed protein product [Pleuronectes platessa]|uniref:Uncharacterized protein n=1 Tax=Pleuronectes platessa TaxID=8262 RepID=A0A9N7UAG3_PLEPL|nr:unnamed protein product [Pleuronectes platessa]
MGAKTTALGYSCGGGQRAISCQPQTSLGGGDAFHRQRRSRAVEPWQQGETQTPQQPVTHHRNGDSTCRQTDVDRQRCHLGRFPPTGGEIQT